MWEFAQTVDYQIKNIVPDGATCHYASPELLRALQLNMEGCDDDHPGAIMTSTHLISIVMFVVGLADNPAFSRQVNLYYSMLLRPGKTPLGASAQDVACT